jgi:hypothetical protein
MSDGIDCALDCTKQAAWIKANGNEFVGRYYRNSASKWTALGAAEAQALSKSGLLVVALWESASDVIDHFSYTTGVDEGTSAYKEAMNTGQPARTPIYFAVDFDCSNLQIAGGINDYFRGVAHGFDAISSNSPAYIVGVYGSGNACAWLLAHQRVTYTWLAQSTGWGGYKTFANWNIKQGPVQKKPFDFDTDQAKPNYGGFTV